MTVQPGLCRTWSEPKLLVFSHTGSDGKLMYNFRGVIQTVVEKHFPAPDRRKFFDIFGLGNSSSYDEDSNLSTPGGNKRKRGKLFLHLINGNFYVFEYFICKFLEGF